MDLELEGGFKRPSELI